MNFQQRVAAFVQLGEWMKEAAEAGHPDFDRAHAHNQWFTLPNTRLAVEAWAAQLAPHKVQQWLEPYNISDQQEPKTIALISAGNIPLVGFHDLLCILVSGNKAIVKLSEDDTVLPTLLIRELIRIGPQLEAYIHISEDRLPKAFDAVIATGSNNTNRYFEYYFRNRPALLRRSRSSAAVLTGNETPEDMQRLGDDIFTYFGLGCRNVSKLYVPEGYDFTTFFEGIESFHGISQHHKYANNYAYHKAIFLMNQTPHLDNGFITLKEDASIASPLGTLFFEYYSDPAQLRETLESRREELQCVVSKTGLPGAIPFGHAQSPELWDYADGVDTMAFLLAL